jgi:tellurite methyltransferase
MLGCTVIRRIEGFDQDDDGDWVAELSCLHGQHVRHEPPFQERPWVRTASGRHERVGQAIECPLCDRAELPDGLAVSRTAGPWDEGTLPQALRRDHRVATHTWGLLRVVDGSVGFTLGGRDIELATGDEQPIPPEVPHAVVGRGPVRLEIDFLVRPPGTDRRSPS